MLKKRATFDPSIFQTRPGGGAEWSTFLALAFFHNLENGAWPSMRTISDITGMDKGQVDQDARGGFCPLGMDQQIDPDS